MSRFFPCPTTGVLPQNEHGLHDRSNRHHLCTSLRLPHMIHFPKCPCTLSVYLPEGRVSPALKLTSDCARSSIGPGRNFLSPIPLLSIPYPSRLPFSLQVQPNLWRPLRVCLYKSVMIQGEILRQRVNTLNERDAVDPSRSPRNTARHSGLDMKSNLVRRPVAVLMLREDLYQTRILGGGKCLNRAQHPGKNSQAADAQPG